MSATFYSWRDDNLNLRIYLQPLASRDEIVGPHHDSLKIRITAPPVDGKANDHLIKYLAREFSVPRRNIELISGHSSRTKQLCIHQPRRLPPLIRPVV